jgi:translation elongation factor EF-G
MHPVDSKDIAFQIAGKEGLPRSFLAARPCLLEPICTVEIRIPEECMGNVIGDLSSRRGKILGMDSADGLSRSFAPTSPKRNSTNTPPSSGRSPAAAAKTSYARGIQSLRGNAQGTRIRNASSPKRRPRKNHV